MAFNLEKPLDATRAPKEILDDVAPNRPVAIMDRLLIPFGVIPKH
jgi:hypothetical protein